MTDDACLYCIQMVVVVADGSSRLEQQRLRTLYTGLRINMAPLIVDERQQELEKLWKSGKEGSVSPMEAMRAWALRGAYQKINVPSKKICAMIVTQVTKIGGGHPTTRALLKLFEKIDTDVDWFPGKEYRTEAKGPKPLMTKQKALGIKRAMESAKEEGLEPTYGLAVARAQRSMHTPHTGEPFSKKVCYAAFRSECSDPGHEDKWDHGPRLQKKALPQKTIDRRLAFGSHMDGRYSAGFFHRFVIWFDLCSSLLPRTVAKTAEQALARKGRKGWASPSARSFSQNLRGDDKSLMLQSTDTLKVWWMPVLVRGKLHVDLLPENFPGECVEGSAIAVSLLPGILNRRFREEAKPRIVMTDRGKGFYNTITGEITPEYAAALRRAELRPLMGDNAAIQPGQAQDLMLHETAVAWIRKKLEWSLPSEPWKETREQHEARLKRIVREINETYDVAGLTHEMPERIAQLIGKGGDRLHK